MKTSAFSLMALFVLFAMGCKNGGFKRTKSGLLYKITSDGKGRKVKNKEFLKFEYVTKVHDSVLSSTYGVAPTYAPVDTTAGATYNPAEVFPMLRIGDSLTIVMLADSLRKRQGGLPPFIRKKDKLVIGFKVLDILPDQASVEKDQTANFNALKEKEIKAVEDYLNKHNIKAQKTEKGTFVVIESPGEGMAIDSGKLVQVKYTGRTLEGKVFDSNVDSSFGHTDPFRLVIYGSPAIEGWHDGLRLFKKGGKGQLYIPSLLAYGSNPPQGAPIKPFDNLMFDVSIVDVSEVPKQPKQNGARDSVGSNNPQR